MMASFLGGLLVPKWRILFGIDPHSHTINFLCNRTRKEHFVYLKQAARKIVAEVASGRGTTISRIYKSLVYVSSKKTMA
jgi:predicted GNAT superfamily acetyltransferase